MGRSSVLRVLLIGAAAAAARAGVYEVHVELPRAARIDLSRAGYETLAVTPFLPPEKREKGERADYAFEKEAARYFQRLLGKETPLKVVEGGADPPPFRNVEALSKDRGFWRQRARDLAVDLLLTGQVLFKTSNRSGYVQNTYQSAITGRMYEDRPTFVYRSGVTLQLDVVLIEGKSGDVLYRDHFLKDRTVDGSGGDPLQNFFDLMRGLSGSVLGIVTPQKTTATRYLLD